MKPENMQQLQDRLRDCYIQYKETSQRCQIQFKSKSSNEAFNRLYYSPNIPFFEEPEKQKVFRKEFIQDVGKLPEPKPIVTLSDVLHSDCFQTIGDRSSPNQTKEELVQFYSRRQAQLQHKKHKILKRWANSYRSSDLIDNISYTFDRELSRLQIEQDSVTSRLMRLMPDDRYSQNDLNERPKPTNNHAGATTPQENQSSSHLYKEADLQTNDSALRQDDFEVFLRHQSFVDKVNRPAKKLIQSLKWLPFEKRYEIWGESRIKMHSYLEKHKEEKYKICYDVTVEIQKKLQEIGIIDTKGIDAVTERYIFHLKEETTTRTQKMLNNMKFSHFEPFMLFAGKSELKQHLLQLASQYGLNCQQLDLDSGQMFTYQLQTFFPSKFEKQVREMTFDWEDTGSNADIQMIDRLTRTLGLNKDDMLNEMSKFSAEQRTQSLLNALNVGKTGQVDLTLKDLTENELNKDQFTRHNLLRKLRQIEFFTLEESEVRMRKADWLQYVCWQPVVSIYTQRQNQLLSSKNNNIDNLLKSAMEFADVNDSVIVNKIVEDSIKIHIQKINDVQARISKCFGANNNIKGPDLNTDSVIQSLIEATNPAIAREAVKKTDPNLTDAQQIHYNKFQDTPNVDPLTHNLTKAFYTLRVIKTRDIKIKLLSVINYFRAIQRILALDVREFMTREKAFGDHINIIDPHFGYNSKNQPILKTQGPAGPSDIFSTTVERELDSKPIKGAKINLDPVTFKGFKFNNSFDPVVISTCPLVPKYHRTFGRPSIYEQISTENEREKGPVINFKRMQALLTMRDRIYVDFQTKEIYVTNEYGMRIIYYESLNDLAELEEELVKIGSYFVNRYEYVIKNNEIMGIEQKTPRPSSLIDRPQIVMDILEKEYNFQFNKVKLVEQYMEIYEHTYDPLESMRILQIIVDLIVARPRLNMEASMYCQSYESEIEVLQEKQELMQEFMDMQKQLENKENQSVQSYLESKIRKLQENVDAYWAAERSGDKNRRVGSNEVAHLFDGGHNNHQTDGDNVDDMLRMKIQQTEKQEAERQEQLAKIRERHITEFANEQFNDFASVLGLPQVTMEQLYLRFDESEPIVLDALRESAFFQKMIEGYPIKLTTEINPKVTNLGQHTPDCGVTDFYESMSIASKFNAALFQAFETMESETLPENGFAASCLELCLIKKARIQLRKTKKVSVEGGFDAEYLKGQELFEEDFYLGNSDKLIYQMKMLHYESNESNLYKQSNPLVMSKLDCQSVQNFNFPRIKAKEVVEALHKEGIDETQINDLLIKKTTQMAKNSVSRPNLTNFGSMHKNENGSQQTQNETQVNVPSMLKMFCNILEVIRLREEIIMRMNECTILSRIYTAQCGVTGKQSKFYINEQVSFNTNQLHSDFMNIVDLNDGNNIEFSPSLPFMEFDKNLSANLDFASDSCIKALMTDLGVEEMRAILHLQIAQQHLLIVAVRTNQVLIDSPLKGLKELDLIESKDGITTPNSIIDINSILVNNSDASSFTLIKNERTRLNGYLNKSISDQFYMILPKKQRDRQILTKRFSQVQSKLVSADVSFKSELILRVLRAYRLQLCFGYSQSMIQEAQKDAIKIQVLETCNTLRFRATLLPNQSQIFRLGKTETQENLSFEANQQLRRIREFVASDNMSINSIMQGHGICSSSQTLYYIPSSEEIILFDRMKESTRLLKEHTQDFVTADTIDEVIKSLNKRPQILQHLTYKLEGKQQYGVRKVWLEESPNLLQNDIYQLLIFVTQLLSIFDLEYTMLRNLSKSWQTQALESKSLTGRPFWTEVDQKKKKLEQLQLNMYKNNESLIENKTSMKVIQMLDQRKKAWIDLEEDLQSVSKKLRKIEINFQELPSEKRTLDFACELLTLQHQSTFFSFLNGIENMLEYYLNLDQKNDPLLEKRNDEYFFKLLQVRDILINKNIHSIKLIKSNGFYIQQSQISANSINIEATNSEEYINFKKAYQTVIDERCLIPRQVTLIKQLYGHESLNQRKETTFGYYNVLLSAFYNMDDEARALMGANFTQVNEYIDDYLVFKGLKEPPGEQKKMMKSKDHFQEQLLAQVEILSFKIEAANLERVIMCWDYSNSTLPNTIKQYQQVQRRFRDSCTMTILHERDNLNDQYWNKLKKSNPLTHMTKAEREKEALSGVVSHVGQRIQYYSKVNQLRAETIVIKNILEVNLIKIAVEMVKNEHSALQNCFEVAALDKQLTIYVHPSQQFASTPYSKVDKAPHLDAVAKVGFLQQFLTRLRNRCTEVETLTSGPGLVFSMKDFNDCLNIFARQLIKYGEEELRGRCETQNLREYQYHHIIYIKQMESLYYRKKCEQLLQNIETLTNAKMLSQGNQMIYEIDVGARELQSLKDHYYIMEKSIRQEIRNEFNDQLLKQSNEIHILKDKFKYFRKEIQIDLQEQISQKIQELDTTIRQQNTARIMAQIHGTKFQRIDFSDMQEGNDPQLVSEILELNKFIRKQKVFHMLKTVRKQEKQDKELAIQKVKLTQNQNLWEQLAEAEKREQITQQELAITKNNLIHYEKLIEKLYTQLEHLNNQKLRLEQYKKNNSKCIRELEGKMQDLEILESLDLNKILEELRQRDRKIVRLDKVDQNFNNRIEQMQGIYETQMDELKKQIVKERSAKLEAFEKLDAMRIEMKTLEGKDSVKNDLWKDKCKELYDICRELEQENENLKLSMKDLQNQVQQKQQYDAQVISLQNSTSENSGFQQPLTREAIILQRKKYAQKPMTATSEQFGGVRRGFSSKDGKNLMTTGQKNLLQGKLIESAINLDSLKISAEGYEKRALNTLRNQTADSGVGVGRNKFLNPKQSGQTATQSSNQGASFGQNHFLTVNQSQKSSGAFPGGGTMLQVSSMPQIKGLHKHFPIALPNQFDEGQLMIDSGTLRVKKS